MRLRPTLSRGLKRAVAIIVIVASFAFLAYYWRTHPEIVTQLKSVSPLAIAAIGGLYLLMTLLLVLIYDTILRLCAKPIPLGEHTLLTMYSSIINFFGPLQSGPGFRTLYLKQRHNVPVKAYVTGTLLYYALFGLVNLVFVVVGVMATAYLPLLLAGLAGSLLIVRRLAGRVGFLARFDRALRSPLLVRLAGLTALQAVLAAIIYAVELQAVGASVSPSQALAYAGAGSLALFVSLTPAALGFRESFQYVTQSLHQVSGPDIVAANVLDRSVYVAFLGLLFVLIVALHAKRRLRLPDTPGSD